MANPELLEEQREETRLIIEELLEDGRVRRLERRRLRGRKRDRRGGFDAADRRAGVGLRDERERFFGP